MVLDTPPKAGPEEWRERHVFLKAATDGGGCYNNDNLCFCPISPAPPRAIFTRN